MKVVVRRRARSSAMGGRSNTCIRWCLRGLSSLCLVLAVSVPFVAWYVYDLATAASVGQLASLPMTAVGLVGTAATRSPSRKREDARHGAERGVATPHHSSTNAFPDARGAVVRSGGPARSSRQIRFAVAASGISCLVALASFTVARSGYFVNVVDPYIGSAPSAAPTAAQTTTEPDVDSLRPAIPAIDPSGTASSDATTTLLFDGEVN